MKRYAVSWHIDVWAENPNDAARQAHEIQQDTNSTATVFSVTEPKPGALTEIIDVAEGGDHR